MKKKILAVLVVLTGFLALSVSIVWAETAPVLKTGQTTSYRTGDDGEHQKGVDTPGPRFTDNGDGTVTDNLTGLMWSKNANLYNSLKTWQYAIDYVNSLTLGSNGCGTSYTDWRLPNRFELESLLCLGNYGPALPTGHPFSNVQSNYYWSSTTHAEDTNHAWHVNMSSGNVFNSGKVTVSYVWPVRSAN